MTNDEINQYALEQLADGELLSVIAEEVGLKRTTLYMRLQETPELVDAYARAREAGHDARAERLSQKTTRELPTLPSGAIDPAAVSQLKLEVDTDKWLLGKVAPRYGDRQQIEHSGSIDLANAVLSARRRVSPE